MRFFLNILKNLIFKRALNINDVSIVKMRVLPTDLDLNFHMNNGRYLTVMDIGRTDYTVRTGMHRLIVKERYAAVAAAVNIAFLKPLAPFSRYELHTKVLSWDDMWFYIEQRFIQDKIIKGSAIVKVTFLKGNKKTSPEEIIKKVQHKDVIRPEMPAYLKELIEGEKHMLAVIKDYNKGVS